MNPSPQTVHVRQVNHRNIIATDNTLGDYYYRLGLEYFSNKQWLQAQRSWLLGANMAAHLPCICDAGWMFTRSYSSTMIKDYYLAFDLMRIAAYLGYPRAQNNLGLYYYYAIGCHRSLLLAIYWLRSARMNSYAKTALSILEASEIEYIKQYGPTLEHSITEITQQMAMAMEFQYGITSTIFRRLTTIQVPVDVSSTSHNNDIFQPAGPTSHRYSMIYQLLQHRVNHHRRLIQKGIQEAEAQQRAIENERYEQELRRQVQEKAKYELESKQEEHERQLRLQYEEHERKVAANAPQINPENNVYARLKLKQYKFTSIPRNFPKPSGVHRSGPNTPTGYGTLPKHKSGSDTESFRSSRTSDYHQNTSRFTTTNATTFDDPSGTMRSGHDSPPAHGKRLTITNTSRYQRRPSHAGSSGDIPRSPHGGMPYGARSTGDVGNNSSHHHLFLDDVSEPDGPIDQDYSHPFVPSPRSTGGSSKPDMGSCSDVMSMRSSLMGDIQEDGPSPTSSQPPSLPREGSNALSTHILHEQNVVSSRRGSTINRIHPPSLHRATSGLSSLHRGPSTFSMKSSDEDQSSRMSLRTSIKSIRSYRSTRDKQDGGVMYPISRQSPLGVGDVGVVGPFDSGLLTVIFTNHSVKHRVEYSPLYEYCSLTTSISSTSPSEPPSLMLQTTPNLSLESFRSFQNDLILLNSFRAQQFHFSFCSMLHRNVFYFQLLEGLSQIISETFTPSSAVAPYGREVATQRTSLRASASNHQLTAQTTGSDHVSQSRLLFLTAFPIADQSVFVQVGDGRSSPADQMKLGRFVSATVEKQRYFHQQRLYRYALSLYRPIFSRLATLTPTIMHTTLSTLSFGQSPSATHQFSATDTTCRLVGEKPFSLTPDDLARALASHFESNLSHPERLLSSLVSTTGGKYPQEQPRRLIVNGNDKLLFAILKEQHQKQLMMGVTSPQQQLTSPPGNGADGMKTKTLALTLINQCSSNYATPGSSKSNSPFIPLDIPPLVTDVQKIDYLQLLHQQALLGDVRSMVTLGVLLTFAHYDEALVIGQRNCREYIKQSQLAQRKQKAVEKKSNLQKLRTQSALLSINEDDHFSSLKGSGVRGTAGGYDSTDETPLPGLTTDTSFINSDSFSGNFGLFSSMSFTNTHDINASLSPKRSGGVDGSDNDSDDDSDDFTPQSTSLLNQVANYHISKHQRIYQPHLYRKEQRKKQGDKRHGDGVSSVPTITFPLSCRFPRPCYIQEEPVMPSAAPNHSLSPRSARQRMQVAKKAPPLIDEARIPGSMLAAMASFVDLLYLPIGQLPFDLPVRNIDDYSDYYGADDDADSEEHSSHDDNDNKESDSDDKEYILHKRRQQSGSQPSSVKHIHPRQDGLAWLVAAAMLHDYHAFIFLFLALSNGIGCDTRPIDALFYLPLSRDSATFFYLYDLVKLVPFHAKVNAYPPEVGYHPIDDVDHQAGLKLYQVSLLTQKKPMLPVVYSLWLKSAHAGNTEAMTDVAYGRLNSFVTPNERIAFSWFFRAALGGNIRAMNNLALCYKDGIGCQIDLYKAYYWLSVAEYYGYNELSTNTLRQLHSYLESRDVDLHAILNGHEEMRLPDVGKTPSANISGTGAPTSVVSSVDDIMNLSYVRTHRASILPGANLSVVAQSQSTSKYQQQPLEYDTLYDFMKDFTQNITTLFHSDFLPQRTSQFPLFQFIYQRLSQYFQQSTTTNFTLNSYDTVITLNSPEFAHLPMESRTAASASHTTGLGVYQTQARSASVFQRNRSSTMSGGAAKPASSSALLQQGNEPLTVTAIQTHLTLSARLLTKTQIQQTLLHKRTKKQSHLGDSSFSHSIGNVDDVGATTIPQEMLDSITRMNALILLASLGLVSDDSLDPQQFLVSQYANMGITGDDDEPDSLNPLPFGSTLNRRGTINHRGSVNFAAQGNTSRRLTIARTTQLASTVTSDGYQGQDPFKAAHLETTSAIDITTGISKQGALLTDPSHADIFTAFFSTLDNSQKQSVLQVLPRIRQLLTPSSLQSQQTLISSPIEQTVQHPHIAHATLPCLVSPFQINLGSLQNNDSHSLPTTASPSQAQQQQSNQQVLTSISATDNGEPRYIAVDSDFVKGTGFQRRKSTMHIPLPSPSSGGLELSPVHSPTAKGEQVQSLYFPSFRASRPLVTNPAPPLQNSSSTDLFHRKPIASTRLLNSVEQDGIPPPPPPMSSEDEDEGGAVYGTDAAEKQQNGGSYQFNQDDEDDRPCVVIFDPRIF